jgi:hypothetical protein
MLTGISQILSARSIPLTTHHQLNPHLERSNACPSPHAAPSQRGGSLAAALLGSALLMLLLLTLLFKDHTHLVNLYVCRYRYRGHFGFGCFVAATDTERGI